MSTLQNYFNETHLPKYWLNNLEILDVAFQPIINMHTAEIYGVEALLRNYQEIGCQSIFSLFDKVYEENLLYAFDLYLRKKAFEKFTTIKNYKNIKIFYNLDNRLLEIPDFSNGNTNKLTQHLNIKKENIFFEISERYELGGNTELEKILQHYKEEDYNIAIDDFGVGYAGYKLLYDSAPDIIKIDRFFLQEIEKNIKKKLLVRNITHLAIQLGIKVIAEGVETNAEFYTCKEIGCHLVQGYLVQRPTKNTSEILSLYTHIAEIISSDKRYSDKSSKLEKHIQKIAPLHIKNKMSVVVEYFKENKETILLPIVNSADELVGVIHETQIKEFLYSPYGISLIFNEESGKSKIKTFLKSCGSTDLNSDMSTIIELFSNDPESIGIIITKNAKYYGFLSSRAIISIMNEENLLLARDQNPLTKLPGNNLIEKYISQIIVSEDTFTLCYFDLDNFKAFNDTYGFRKGDRIIQLFAELIRKNLPPKSFKAHIGGDDFFVAFKDSNDETYMKNIEYIKEIIANFSSGARAFYSAEDKENGYIIAKDRENNIKKFPLLTVSASVLIISSHTKNRSSEMIHNVLSLQKKVAKHGMKKKAVSMLL